MKSETAKVAVDDAADAAVILNWKCPAKANGAGKNMVNASFMKAKNTPVAPTFVLLAKTTTVAPLFALLFEAAVTVALVTTNIANTYNLYATSPILGNRIIMRQFRQTSLLILLKLLTPVDLALVEK